jgi:Mg/Co/Ni transporter MgtE
MIQKRASWLVILFLGELLTATAMGFFETEIAKAVVLALFIPLIISSGGNSGAASTQMRQKRNRASPIAGHSCCTCGTIAGYRSRS